MRLMAERCQVLTGADGAMVSMLQGDDMLLTTAATGCAADVLGAVRPLADVGGQARDLRRAAAPDRGLRDRSARQPRAPAARGRQVADLRPAVPRLPRDRRAQRDEPLGARARLTEADRETMEMLAVVLSAAMSHASEFEAISRFRALFDGASIGILVLGPDGRAREANPAVAEMLGYSAGRARRHRASATTPIPTTSTRSAALFAEMMSGRQRLPPGRAALLPPRRRGDVGPAHRRARARRRRAGRPSPSR